LQPSPAPMLHSQPEESFIKKHILSREVTRVMARTIRKVQLYRLKENEVPPALQVGAKAHILAKGDPDQPTSADVTGYYMYFEFPNGGAAGLVLRWKNQAKHFKTLDGARSQYKMFHPNDRYLERLPLVPEVRSEDEFWRFITRKNADLNL